MTCGGAVVDASRSALVTAANVLRALGCLEKVDAATTRLVGRTGNPWRYAEQRLVTEPGVPARRWVRHGVDYARSLPPK